MSISDDFKGLFVNLAVKNSEQISNRYGEITLSLNKYFRNLESRTSYSLQVGSYGRHTAINGISDLDMLYIVQSGEWEKYRKSGPYSLLNDTKIAIKNRYPRTEVFVDRLVVRVLYNNFHVEVQPVFELDDGSFKYPDSYKEGSWKITKPRQEMAALSEFNDQKNKNLRRLCKMLRAWKNKHGVEMGGLLIDTLAHNYLKSTNYYDEKSYSYYGQLSSDVFLYLSQLQEQDYYAALGSGQRVKVKKKFQRKAKNAHRLCEEAIAASGQKNANEKWKKVYGRPFPSAESAVVESKLSTFKTTEEFIEDRYPVDIRYNISIDCEVSQNGFREHLLRYIILNKLPLKTSKKLRFFVDSSDVKGPYKLYWKILNRGYEAEKRDCIRGQIVEDSGHEERIEQTNFKGDHIVECYAIQNDVVVAKDRIHVPIQ